MGVHSSPDGVFGLLGSLVVLVSLLGFSRGTTDDVVSYGPSGSLGCHVFTWVLAVCIRVVSGPTLHILRVMGGATGV